MDEISRAGGTPLVVADGREMLGTIQLKDGGDVFPNISGGKIVAIGTDAGRVATVGESFIGGATGGMMQMCRVLARELGRDGIRVNAVAMSYIADAEPRWGGASPELASHERGMLQQLKKRMLFPVHCADIAQAAAFFAGPESDAITGQTLSVNGGLSTPG